MTHEELRDRLLDLAYGELSPRDAREVEEHAAACEACRAELAAMRGTRRVMAALPVEPAPERGERILVAAAREAVRARPPRRPWPRWLWAAPVAAASLAAVVALSLRLGAVRPPDAAREDPNALRGESPYAAQATPPAAAAPPPASPAREADQVSKGALAERPEPARPAPKKAEAPRRDAAESRFATAPEDETARATPRERAPGPQQPAAAPAAPPPPAAVASAPPAAPGAAAGAGPSAGAVAAQQELAAAQAQETRREAAPERRAAKSMAAPEARDAAVVAPRERALAAARVRADELGFDAAGTRTQVGAAAVTWETWRAQDPALRSAAAPAAVNGRRFWPVTFSRGGAPGGTLTILVEDGTFRPLAELRGE
jgi:hypothetical protein